MRGPRRKLWKEVRGRPLASASLPVPSPQQLCVIPQQDSSSKDAPAWGLRTHLQDQVPLPQGAGIFPMVAIHINGQKSPHVCWDDSWEQVEDHGRGRAEIRIPCPGLTGLRECDGKLKQKQKQ